MPSNPEYDSLEDVLKKVSLAKYIEHHWQPLKKIGSEYKTICPFHDDKNPSLSVNDEKGLYYCYSCKAGGNLITFIKDFKNLNSQEAIKEIEDFFNVKISTTNYNIPDDSNKKNKLFSVNNLIAELYNKFLSTNKSGAKAISYLKSRGFDDEDIKENMIGFAPDSWNFLSSFVKNKIEKLNVLEDLGLVKKKEGSNNFFDFFRNRIIFPIKNRQGVIMGFAGRSIDNSNPKYLNSKESIIFSKRKVLFGIDKFDKLKGKKPKFVLLVEGYTDVLMLNKIGFYNVVASMGTSLTLEHSNEIKKFSDKIIINFDSDKAGIDAAFKSIEPLFENNFDVYKLDLPHGQDPCEYIQKNGSDAFLNLLNASVSIIDSFIDYSKQQYLNKEKSLNYIISDFTTKVSLVRDIFNRDLMINKFISAFSLSKRELENKIYIQENQPIDSKFNDEKNINDPNDIALKILLENVELRSKYFLECIKDNSDKRYEKIIRLLEDNINMDPSGLISVASSEESNIISNLLFAKITIDGDPIKKEKTLHDCIKKIKIESLKEKKRRINMKLNHQSEITSDEEHKLLMMLQEIIEEEKNLKN